MRPSTVWMVSARTGVTGRKGTLLLEADSVVFRPASTAFGDTIIPLKALRKVRRVRGSPVLEISVAMRDQPAMVAFYFVPPPDLNPPNDLRIRLLPKRAARKDAITQLRQGNLRKKAEIGAWADALERARRV
ncbi:MAG TPA: hypothetical protein VHI54_00320 [Actinomycetota bacterium]|nr:hypothetical protein [Actinomycetota bacterium]